MAKDWARMEEKARILIVDDDESTCRSMKVIFEAKNYDTDIVHTGQEAIAAIKKRSFNLAVLDIRLPDVDGITLLEQLSKMNADLGIIMITGYASMETAVDSLNKGAAAYITKPLNMDEVLITVNKALEKQRLTRAKLRAEAALQEERDRAQKYLDIAGVMFVCLDLDGAVTLVNRSGCEILGYESKEIIGKDWFKTFIPKRLRKEVYRAFSSLMKGDIEPVEYFENPILTKAGEERVIAWHNTVMKNSKSRIVGILSSGEDITERHRAEEALRESVALLNTTGQMAKVGGWTLDAKTQEVSWTEETYRIHEVPLDQKPPLKDAINFFHPDEREKLATAIQRALDHGEPYDMELRFITAKGKELWTHTICKPQVINGKTVKLLGTFQDITDRKEAERAVERSEEKFRSIFEESPIGIDVFDSDGILIEGNKACLDVFGVSLDDLRGFYLFDDPNVPEEAKKRIRNGETVRYQAPFDFEKVKERGSYETSKSGIAYLNTVITPFGLGEDGSFRGYIVQMQDVTERKIVEEALKKSKQRYQDFLMFLPQGVGITDMDENFTYANQAFADLLGYPMEELVQKNVFDLIPAEGQRVVRAETERRKHHLASTYEVQMIRKDGELRLVEVSTIPQKGDEGNVIGTIGVLSDITERKLAAAAIKQSEEQYRKLYDEVRVGLLTTSVAEGKFVQCNAHFVEMFGFESREQAIAEGISLERYANPDDRQQIISELKKSGAFSGELALTKVDGTPIWVDVSSHIDLEAGTIQSAFLDITERKRAEEALRQSEEWFRTIYEESPIAINVFDLDGNLVHANPALLNLVGVSSVEDFRNFNIFKDPNLPEGGVQRIRNNESTRYQSVIDFAKVKEAGLYDTSKSGVSHVDVRMSPLKYGEDESLHGYMIQMVDITDRVLAEKAVEKRVRELTCLFGTSQLASESELAIDAFLKGVVELLPPAWFHAEITCARILLDGLEFTTSNFKETRWKGVTDITVGTERRGAIEVYYLEQRQDFDEGPFLKEERALIDSIAELVGNAVGRWQAEENLHELTEELEQRVEKRTQDLVDANQELEAFAYSVSHDLRSPLRGIAGFSRAVIEDYSEVLDETGRDYLRRMHDATVRMSELIDDILSLSRVSREEMHSEEIDMTALARTIAGDLRSQEPKRKAKLVISTNLEAYGDKRLLCLVLENLLGNAWKFTSKQRSARIEFGATEQENETVFFVRDNGAGFDMKYVDKLFNVFQRLHHADEFEGTGIGLAIVKRIISRHGGRTWAEGNVGTGATFYFALPSKGSEVLT